MPKIKVIRWITALCLATMAPTVAVGQMIYFGGGIDYWASGEDGKDRGATAKPAVPKDFDWQPYLDPAHDEFFREGDYLPPKPFMAVARDPTDENLRQWFAYMGAKNAVASRLGARMQEYLARQQHVEPPTDPQATQPPPDHPAFDPKRFAMRFYFEATCPHCRRMIPEIGRLRDLGIRIDARQVDEVPLGGETALGADHVLATREEIAKQGFEGVPLLLIADLKTKALYRLGGYQSAEAVVELLRGKS